MWYDITNWHLLSHAQLHVIQYSQWDRQVFSILLSPCQRHGESWVYPLALDFIDDVDLELIVIHCRKEEFAKSGKMHGQRINRQSIEILPNFLGKRILPFRAESWWLFHFIFQTNLLKLKCHFFLVVAVLCNLLVFEALLLYLKDGEKGNQCSVSFWDKVFFMGNISAFLKFNCQNFWQALYLVTRQILVTGHD